MNFNNRNPFTLQFLHLSIYILNGFFYNMQLVNYLDLLKRHMGTVDFGLQLYVSATTSLVGYTDVDWAAKRQHTLSRSSTEAEYRGVANVVV
ncbi:hypothetical protein Tco_0814440 [Tanacetum coccineum]